MDLFNEHATAGFWNFIPSTADLLQRTAQVIRQLPATVPLRAGDAIHLASAMHAGEGEIWTNDRHLLAAAASIGLAGKSVVG